MKLWKTKTSSPSEDRVIFLKGKQIRVGRFTYGIENIFLHTWGETESLTIGRYCSLASIHIFLGGNHRSDWVSTFPFGHIHQEYFDIASLEHPSSNGDVIIGNDVWIGNGATIMSGVTIGDGAVIGANAHIVKNVAPYSIVGGNPAQLIRYRFSTETINALLQLRWWELSISEVKKITPSLCCPPNLTDIHKLIEKTDSLIRN
jgi:acetyltransferase-like isoleucine patch superfamily enzyme